MKKKRKQGISVLNKKGGIGRFLKPLKQSRAKVAVKLPYYPQCPGVYVLSGKSHEILYIGFSRKLSQRVSHLTAMQRDKSNRQKRSHIKANKLRRYQETHGEVHITFVTTKTKKQAREVERRLLQLIKTKWNKS